MPRTVIKLQDWTCLRQTKGMDTRSLLIRQENSHIFDRDECWAHSCFLWTKHMSNVFLVTLFFGKLALKWTGGEEEDFHIYSYKVLWKSIFEDVLDHIQFLSMLNKRCSPWHKKDKKTKKLGSANRNHAKQRKKCSLLLLLELPGLKQVINCRTSPFLSTILKWCFSGIGTCSSELLSTPSTSLCEQSTNTPCTIRPQKPVGKTFCAILANYKTRVHNDGLVKGKWERTAIWQAAPPTRKRLATAETPSSPRAIYMQPAPIPLLSLTNTVFCTASLAF